MKIIDENFDSFENRSLNNFNPLQRYLTVKPDIANFQPKRPCLKAEKPKSSLKLPIIVTPEVIKEKDLTELDKSKDSNLDNKSQNTS